MTNGDDTERVQLDLTAREASLVVAALRQFEPYWPAQETPQSQAQLLADLREAIDHILATLQPTARP